MSLDILYVYTSITENTFMNYCQQFESKHTGPLRVLNFNVKMK